MAEQTDELRRTRHAKIPKAKNGKPRCWVTVFYDFHNRVDVVIGAPTKKRCVEAFERLTNETCDSTKVKFSEFRQVKRRG